MSSGDSAIYFHRRTPVSGLKVALVVPGGVDRSGEYRVIPALVALIQRLAPRVGLRVFALSQQPEPGHWELAGAPVENIGLGSTSLRTIMALRRAHRAVPFNVIHSVWSGAVGFCSVTAARSLGVPCLVHVAGGELAELRDIHYGGRLHWWGRAREALILRSAHCVTAASAPVLAQLTSIGVRARRVPLGVGLDRWPPLPPRRRAPDEPARLLHVASLNRVKDQTTLLHALRLLLDRGIDVSLDVVGEDTLGGAMQALGVELQLGERVRWWGFRTQAALRPIVEAATIHVVSSRHEAGPLSMLEAAVAGVPTVGTAVGHVCEWSPGAAISVPVGDAPRLAHALGLLLADENLRLRLAVEAQRLALVEDADCTASQFLNIYDELDRSGVTK